ncbi:MAG: hypothetical protein VW687_08395 [Curvibacter sp.]
MSFENPNPVFLLDSAGGQVDHNPAAARLLARHPELPARLQRMVQAQAADSTTPLPEEYRLRLADMALGEARVSRTAKGYVVVLEPGDAWPARQRHLDIGSTQDVAYSSLINQELLHEIDALQQQLSNGAEPVPRKTGAIQARMQRVRQLLDTVGLLASTQRAPDFSLGEIVSLPDLLQEVMRELPGLQASIAPAASTTAPALPGTLFARRQWLRAALRALLAHQQRMQPASLLRLDIEHQEGFIALHCSATPSETSGAGSAQTSLPQPPGVDLALARHIIDLHGGQLEMPLDRSTALQTGGFHLSLPTGVPPHGYANPACQQCIYPGLARVFAKDLGRLLPRKPVRVQISQEELQLLEQLHQNLSQNHELQHKEQSS